MKDLYIIILIITLFLIGWAFIFAWAKLKEEAFEEEEFNYSNTRNVKKAKKKKIPGKI